MSPWTILILNYHECDCVIASPVSRAGTKAGEDVLSYCTLGDYWHVFVFFLHLFSFHMGGQ